MTNFFHSESKKLSCASKQEELVHKRIGTTPLSLTPTVGKRHAQGLLFMQVVHSLKGICCLSQMSGALALVGGSCFIPH